MSAEQAKGKQLAGPEQLFIDDLKKSGITREDIGAYIAGPSELTACNLGMYAEQGSMQSPGYVIPYYDIKGKRVPFYRIRLFNVAPDRPKYLQPANTASYIYYPRKFQEMVRKLEDGELPRTKINGYQPQLLIVEGEKKAEKAAKEGFLCIGLGGVYNWRSRTMLLPKDTKVARDESSGLITIKLPSDSEAVDEIETIVKHKWAVGFADVIAMIHKYDLNVVIAFDSDYPENPKVQKAAASLGFELRSLGIKMTRIRQLRLPAGDKQKVAIDDFLMDEGADKLTTLLHELLSDRNAFPTYPNMREYVNRKLSRNIHRDEAKDIAAAILTDMDAKGSRLQDIDTGTPYYFDGDSKKLLRVNMLRHTQEPLHESDFGRMLYQRYDIAQSDHKVLPWIASGFTGEEPVYPVQPKSVLTLLPDGTVALQISDGQYIRVTPDPKKPFIVADNGTGGILFKSDQVDPVNISLLQSHLKDQLSKPFEAWWIDCLKEFKWVRPNDLYLAALLFYIAPWLLRWKGTQLPVELMIGEAGSGKSSMYMLRMTILTGRPMLRNQSSDLRDWYASITGVDGLHVTDNVHFVSKEIKQRLSDEICRIVTEPDPYVEMRKLYTTSDNYRLPVRSVFALTAIQQPFTNSDIIQRAAIFELNAVGGEHDNDWVGRHIRTRGGREAWIAHHLIAIHRFLRAANEGKWDERYKSHHRLVNYEQCLSLMAEITNIGTADQVTKEFMRYAEDQVSDYDWTMEALKEFAEYALPQLMVNPKTAFTTGHIADWASTKDEYKDNQNLVGARKLSRYMKAHMTMITQVTGIFEFTKVGTQITYRVKPIKKI